MLDWGYLDYERFDLKTDVGLFLRLSIAEKCSHTHSLILQIAGLNRGIVGLNGCDWHQEKSVAKCVSAVKSTGFQRQPTEPGNESVQFVCG